MVLPPPALLSFTVWLKTVGWEMGVGKGVKEPKVWSWFWRLKEKQRRQRTKVVGHVGISVTDIEAKNLL